MTSLHYFEQRKILIATQHGKEQVMAPILERELNLNSTVSENFNTDLLGTFTGEIERNDDPLTTVRKKCLMAMELDHHDLAIANEGSFGAHPALYFIQADEELVMLVDQKNGIEITAREISTDTNFNGAYVKTLHELLEFAEKALFPSHALIIRKEKNDGTEIIKGIHQPEDLKTAFDDFMDKYGKVYVETDMRAMYNPSRMQVIEKATAKLVEKMKSCCPGCGTPGYSVTDATQGLRCQLCTLPTRSTLSHIYTCQKCDYTEEKLYPQGKMHEDPMYCDYCNP